MLSGSATSALAAALLVARGATGAPPNMAVWKNSTEGIHAFLTFDSGATAPAIKEYGARIDYVWGHGPNQGC
jgi:hypothetical protein